MTQQVPDGPSPRSTATDFTYDAFIIHAASDGWFVEGYLLGKLGLLPDRVLVPGRLEPGELVISEIERGVRSSRATIVVLSSAYVADHWAVLGEQIVAYASVAKDSHGTLLPLLREDCDLPVHVRALVMLDFRDPARDAWDAEADRLRHFLGRHVARDADVPCPYPGMRPFTESDATRFFGRDAELDDLICRLQRGDRAIYVIGPSGSGKSSLIAAGLLPRLARGVAGLPAYSVHTLRPGEQPLARLAGALEGDAAAPLPALSPLLARRAPATALLLVIDQLEELFAITGVDERTAFAAAARELRSDPRCVMIFTLRADFYGAFMESPLWTDVNGQLSRVEVGALRGNSLRVVIERPARDVGVHIQPELVSRLIADAAREPGALPLLQATLFRLWRKRRQHLLAVSDYEAMGDRTRTGLAFAVSEHAEEVLEALSKAQQAIAFRILLRLINFGEGRADTRRQQPLPALRSHLESASELDAVLARLVEHRLVTVTGDRSGPVRVDLAHEILIEAWSTLAGWIRTWRVAEVRRRELEAAAAAWRARGSGEGGLLDASEVAAATAWREDSAASLGHTVDLAAFFEASEVALGQHRRRRVWLMLGAVVLLVIVTSILTSTAAHNAKEATEQRERHHRWAEKLLRVSQENGRQHLEDERPLEAMEELAEAWATAEEMNRAPSESFRMLLAQATQRLPIAPPLAHRGSVSSAAFSPDGKRVVTASWDHSARVWDAASGKPLSAPLAHRGNVENAAFSPDGTRVVTASADGTARIWDATSGKPLSPPLHHQAPVQGAAFSPDGTRVVTASSDGTARVWDATSGEPLSPPLAHRDSVWSAAFSPDGTLVVTASSDNTARIWDATSGTPLSPALVHRGVVKTAVFSPDGTRVATASNDRTGRVWDAVSGKPISPPLSHDDSVASIAFDSGGTRVVTSSRDNTARVWDALSGRPLTRPLEHKRPVNRAMFSPNGTRIVTASLDNNARVWDSSSGSPLFPSFTHRESVWDVAFDPDGTRIVTASVDNTARIWMLAPDSPLLLSLAHPAAVQSATFSPDGTRVVTVSDNTAQIWDATYGFSRSPLLAHDDLVMSAALSADGTRVVTGSRDRTARVWSASSGEALSPPLVHQRAVASAALSPDGARVVTTTEDHTVHLWDVLSGVRLSPPLTDGAVVTAAFSPDGIRVVTTNGDHTAYVWDAVAGTLLSPPLVHPSLITSAALSRDGTRLVSTDRSNAARIWDVASGKPLSFPLTHQGPIWSAAFSPDGSRVVTASEDRTARIWDAASGKPLSPPLTHEGPVWSAAFSPDGTRVITASDDTTARIWSLPLVLGTRTDWRAFVDRVYPSLLDKGVSSFATALGDQSWTVRFSPAAPSISSRRIWPEYGN